MQHTLLDADQEMNELGPFLIKNQADTKDPASKDVFLKVGARSAKRNARPIDVTLKEKSASRM